MAASLEALRPRPGYLLPSSLSSPPTTIATEAATESATEAATESCYMVLLLLMLPNSALEPTPGVRFGVFVRCDMGGGVRFF
jgi:hypothetical protein